MLEHLFVVQLAAYHSQKNRAPQDLHLSTEELAEKRQCGHLFAAYINGWTALKCSVCLEEGKVVGCSGCLRSFHIECLCGCERQAFCFVEVLNAMHVPVLPFM